MENTPPDLATETVRPGAIYIVAAVCFVGGELLATVFNALGVSITHFPGGLTGLASLSAPPAWSIVLGLVGLWIGMAAAAWFARERGGLALPLALFRLRVGDLKFVALGVGAQYAIDYAYAPFHVRSMNVPIRHLFGGATGLSFAIVAICTTVFAPMMEELLFRGVLFRSLATARPGRTGSIVAAVLSALLFALAHGEVAQFPGLFLLGVVLAWTVAKTRRLAPAIVTHMSFNAVALMTLMIQRAGHA